MEKDMDLIVKIKLDDERIQSIMERLENAREALWDCYMELSGNSYITLKSATPQNEVAPNEVDEHQC